MGQNGTVPGMTSTGTGPDGPVAAWAPSHARTSLSLLADGTHVNLLGNVHGGVVMRLVDSTAGAVAQRHSGGPAVTAAMDEMAFLDEAKATYTALAPLIQKGARFIGISTPNGADGNFFYHAFFGIPIER